MNISTNSDHVDLCKRCCWREIPSQNFHQNSVSSDYSPPTGIAVIFGVLLVICFSWYLFCQLVVIDISFYQLSMIGVILSQKLHFFRGCTTYTLSPSTELIHKYLCNAPAFMLKRCINAVIHSKEQCNPCNFCFFFLAGNVITLTGLNLRYCPVTFPPQRIVDQGVQSILQYLRSALARWPVSEEKILPAGESKAPLKNAAVTCSVSMCISSHLLFWSKIGHQLIKIAPFPGTTSLVCLLLPWWLSAKL